VWALELRRVAHSVPIVPLGQTCLPANLAIRWGFRTIAKSPFIAGLFIGKSIEAALADDLAAFADSSRYKVTTTPSGIDALSIPVYNAFLPHESGPFWTGPAGLRNTVRLYGARSAKFRAALSAEKVLLVFCQRYTAAVASLLRALDSFAPGMSFHMLAVDHSPDGTFAAAGPHDARVTWLHSPMPHQGYDASWAASSAYNTPEGFAFEAPIARGIADCLAALAASGPSRLVTQA
jgi:hypothetical protein